MKQVITSKQLLTLNDNQRMSLEKWCVEKDCEPNLSIGQMIEFIEEKRPIKTIAKNRFGKWFVNIDTAMLGHKDELCDALWEATTQLLKT